MASSSPASAFASAPRSLQPRSRAASSKPRRASSLGSGSGVLAANVSPGAGPTPHSRARSITPSAWMSEATLLPWLATSGAV